MKEIMAIIRMDMINKTKDALLKEEFPSLHCKKVMGRGKKKVDYSLIEDLINGNEMMSPMLAEVVSEGHRLLPKRLLSLIVEDDQVKKAVEIIINTNSKGKQGDGKIFVLPILDTIRVRTGETGNEAV
ncbi:P-II family nitrogen regulator [Pseudobacteroides cellulosolvens]|uniref:Nitrogen regulatory protein P-II n=1 Tax=Pseudobacteroides cellulosolvens ATCC 35603 = DSM 2933 TaxID=398512 RepID=A0A0L6JWE4_9FIRM|nr:P-II family nitrogen regulator [Pseudobacteroides cellulosolvens]KNY30054.1 nitrogen regulatory protein P-II [Pseudobacteroides cellulosolvens ATCC 35603 = DSM 2933]